MGEMVGEGVIASPDPQLYCAALQSAFKLKR